MSEYVTVSARQKETEVGGVIASKCSPLGRKIGPTPVVPKRPFGTDNTPLGTVKIILVQRSRRGRSSAALLDGTMLVASSRQPFLD